MEKFFGELEVLLYLCGMENNKQTAVEWFAEQIIRKHPIITQYLPNYNFDKELIEQAKEIEKQQIIDSHIHGHNAPSSTVKMYDAEQYYNEEYGGNK